MGLGASGALCGILPWWVSCRFQQFKAAGQHKQCESLVLMFGSQILQEFSNLDSETVGHGVHLGGMLFGLVVLLGRWIMRMSSSSRGTNIRLPVWTRSVSNTPCAVPHTISSLLLAVWTSKKQIASDLAFLE